MENDRDTYISERSSPLSSSKHTSQPATSPKKPNTLQYSYNQLPENGVPLAVQYKQAKEQEKKLKKSQRKAEPGEGGLAPLPEPPPDFMSNYYPYTYYSQLRQPEKPKTYQPTADGHVVPNESLDLSRYIHKPAKTPPVKTRRRHRRESPHDSAMSQANPEKQTSETIPPSNNVNQAKEPTPAPANSNLERMQSETRVKTETNSRGSKLHRHHHHHRHQSPEKEYIDAEFQVIDISFKKSQRSPFFSQPKDPYQLPPPNVYNVSSYFPPISNPLPPPNNTQRRDSPPPPQTSQSDRAPNFYDRYLNKIIRERIRR